MSYSIPSPSLTLEESLKLCKDPGPATKDFDLKHTMYRIKDPKKSIPFYTEVLGMRLVDRADFPNMKFSIYFLRYEKQEIIPGEFGDMIRKAWTTARDNSLELTHNWGTENDPDFKYHTGNSEPRGFGHIAIMVPDLEEACERFESLGVNFIKRLQDGVMKTIAFIADPDGYCIEIFNNEV